MVLRSEMFAECPMRECSWCNKLVSLVRLWRCFVQVLHRCDFSFSHTAQTHICRRHFLALYQKEAMGCAQSKVEAASTSPSAAAAATKSNAPAKLSLQQQPSSKEHVLPEKCVLRYAACHITFAMMQYAMWCFVVAQVRPPCVAGS